jgi:GTP-binding protein HflX
MGAFKATLEELADAHLLLHVVDVSNPRFEEQIRAVDRILQDLELDQIPRILVFNKIDLIPAEEVAPLCRRFEAIAVSARHRETFSDLLREMEERCWGQEIRGN